MVDRFNLFVAQLLFTMRDGLRRQDGQTMAEYALILGLITIVTIVTLQALGTGVKTKLISVCSALTGTSVGCS